MAVKWRIYIKPFDDLGAYTDWVDVTDDVYLDGVGNISSDLDNTEYDIGVYRTSNFNIKLRNDHGKYSDVGTSETMFKYTRGNSLVKITHQGYDIDPYCGFAPCGYSYLSEETTIFTGLINDESLTMDLDQQSISLTCLGRESLFSKTIVPFGSISAGDTVSEVLYACLNQSAITNLLTVSAPNITPDLDQEIDSIASLQNKTVQEALNKLLLASNSVLWIDGDAIKVTPRQPTVSVIKTFYGQASPNGPENIQAIKAIKSGLSRVFNFVSWKDVATAAQDSTSVAKYGIRKKEVDFEFFTNATKQQNILTAIKDEFKLPKMEFDLYTPLDETTLSLKLLDQISIDYPSVALPENEEVPVFGSAIAGVAIAPKVLWSFNIEPLDTLKIIGKSIIIKSQLVKLKVRKI